MTTPELIEYIKNELSYGRSREIIAGKLKIEGWADGDIIEAFGIVAKASVPVSDPTPVIEQQSSVLDNKIVGNIYASSPATRTSRSCSNRH